MTDKLELGERVKRLRLSRNLTLKQVEREAKVSATHISEIERGLTSPTVGALRRLAAALGVPASRLVEEDAMPAFSVVRAGERRTLVDPVWGARLQSLSTGVAKRRMSLVEIELEPGRVNVPARMIHRGEAFVHVLRGVVEATLPSGRRVLKEGDSIHYRVAQAQGVRNIGDAPARIVWVASPPAGL